MPIESPLTLRPIDQEQFAELDYQVMRHAFDSQNELGRLCDEIIYQNDLAARSDAARLGPVRKEVPVRPDSPSNRLCHPDKVIWQEEREAAPAFENFRTLCKQTEVLLQLQL